MPTARIYIQRKASGCCVYCGKDERAPGCLSCEACLEQRRPAKRRYYVTHAQQAREQRWLAPGMNTVACCGQWHPVVEVPTTLACCGRILGMREVLDKAGVIL